MTETRSKLLPSSALFGASGRMGRAISALAGPAVTARVGRSLGGELGLVSGDDALGCADVVIDVSTAAACASLATRVAGSGRPPMVIGVTGFTAEEDAAIVAAARHIAIVRSGNFSLGVNVMLGLVRQAAARLSALDFDIEIAESHHRNKVDAPSGTALMLGRAAAQGRGVDLASVEVRARDGLTGPRPIGAIGFSVQRGGGVIGEHSVGFFSDEEILTLSHSARDRSLFARGALVAAKWVVGKPAGLYDMQDVLDLA